jgi:hypothetical protein
MELNCIVISSDKNMIYKNKSARRGAPFVPIGMPTTCRNSAPPKETNMLSMRPLKQIKTFAIETTTKLEPLISHTGILMTIYLSIILDLQNFFH